ncbi:MAG: hypothetical protein KI793_00480 [Rivularia sp. (in: Bacteria)]|nr:hypothetical protein [Rivularia sp. MS3]
MKYSEQITFRTTEKILTRIENLSKERKVSKAQIINELLENALGITSKPIPNIYEELEKKLSQKMDERIQEIKEELEQAIKK